MLWLICWVLGFLGPSLLLFSLILSRRKYKGMVSFKPNSLRYGRNVFFGLLSLLVLNTIFFENFIKYKNVYYILSIITGLIGVISIAMSVWVLIDANGKTYQELYLATSKMNQPHKINESKQ